MSCWESGERGFKAPRERGIKSRHRVKQHTQGHTHITIYLSTELKNLSQIFAFFSLLTRHE